MKILEDQTREWLEVDGLGGFASGAVSLDVLADKEKRS
jgi:hypothetical protein